MHSKIPHDPYKTLGIPRDATLSLIRNARRKLILEHHPDRNPETEKQACLAKFLAIEEAYKVLSDPAQRKEYDQQTNSGEAYRIRRFSEETSRKATEYLYMGSQEFRSRKSTNSFTRSGTIPSNTRSRGNREAVTRERPRIGIVYDATCNVSSDSESDSSSYSDPRTSSVSAARRGRQQSQGL